MGVMLKFKTSRVLYFVTSLIIAGGITWLVGARQISDELISRWIRQADFEFEHRGHCLSETPAIDSLVRAGKRAVPQLLAELDKVGGDDYTAITILGMIGPRANAATRRLRMIAREQAGVEYGHSSLAFDALREITPGDASLIDLAGEITRKGESAGVSFLIESGSAGHPVIARLVTEMEEPPVELLRSFTDNGGELAVVEDQLLAGIRERYKQGDPPDRDPTGYRRNRTQWATDQLSNRPEEYNALFLKWQAEYDALPEAVRLFVAENIWRLGDGAVPVIRRLLPVVEHNDQIELIRSARRLDDGGVALADDLCSVLWDNPGLGFEACLALAGMGDVGMEQLFEVAEWDHERSRYYVIDAIERCAEEVGPDSVPIIFDLFVAADKHDRVLAANWLRNKWIWYEEKQALLPQYYPLLDSADQNLVYWTANIIISLKYGSTEDYQDGATGLYQAALQDEHPAVRCKAREQLDKEAVRQAESAAAGK